jgi:phosphatidylserine decarboxylase
MFTAGYRLLTELSSRKWISMLAGLFAKSSWSRRLIPSFAKTYGISIDEAEKQLSEYVSLNDFFTRRLKSGLRPLDEDYTQVISPVDGLITSMGHIQDGLLIGIKGQTYTIHELLNSSPRVINYLHGYYLVIYLSPKDYHRIHAPVTGQIMEKEHVPGKVYPVNDLGLTHMRKVLSRNERLITYIAHETSEVAVVKVGAMNVSSIQYASSLSTHIVRGDELAYFEFGSTVVLLLENDTFSPKATMQVNTKIHMGQSLGVIHTIS